MNQSTQLDLLSDAMNIICTRQ